MIKRILSYIVVSAIFLPAVYAKPLKELPSEKRVVNAKRVTDHIKIDGILDELAWEDAQVANDFYQYEPYNGSFPSEKSAVKILYDDVSIYIGAALFDEQPDGIFRELGKRDNSDNLKSDVFSILISPYNDGINYLEFIVSA